MGSVQVQGSLYVGGMAHLGERERRRPAEERAGVVFEQRLNLLLDARDEVGGRGVGGGLVGG